MCGICGVIHGDTSKTANIRRVEAMTEAMRRRGPDDGGLWQGRPHVALGIRRLSVLDIPGSKQPMTAADGAIALVFNGEIYNFAELRTGLERLGHVFQTRGDTEVLLRAYETWGDACLHRLNGMFAFAVYDARTNRLLLARDRLGVKPLFYIERGGALAFASELDALTRSGFIDTSNVDHGALAAYFEFLYIPGPDTIYTGARKLQPGEKLIYENGEARLERYWRFTLKPDAHWTLAAAAERYRELVDDSVRLQRISDVPLGVFLSGGIDSSTITAALAAQSSQAVKTFTIGFNDAQADELKYARLAAEAFRTDHTEATLEPDVIAWTESLARDFGEPFADSSALPTWLVSNVARQRVTVALGGDGGDELFAGYTWLHMNRRVARYRRVPEPLRRFVDRGLRLAPPGEIFKKLRRFNSDSFLEPMASFRRRLGCFPQDEQRRLFLPEVFERVAGARHDRFEQRIAETGDLASDDRMLYLDTTQYLPDDILTKVDRMSMARSLEARVPLLDHRLVEFAAALPFELKYADGVSKRVVKEAFKDVLPAPLLAQRKRGFAIPIHRWFREELRMRFRARVLQPDSRCAAWLDMNYVRNLAEAHNTRRGQYGHHLWAILMFEEWLRYRESLRRDT